MAAIVSSPPIVPTVRQSAFTASARDVVHPDRTTAAAKSLNLGATLKAKLPAHNPRVVIVERIVADRTPHTIAVNLHPPTSSRIGGRTQAQRGSRNRWSIRGRLRRGRRRGILRRGRSGGRGRGRSGGRRRGLGRRILRCRRGGGRTRRALLDDLNALSTVVAAPHRC